MHYLEIYNDVNGTSHLAHHYWAMKVGDFTPPSPSGYQVSDMMSANSMLMMHHPAGYRDDWHCAPAMVLGTVLSGSVRISTSDDDQHILSPGDQFLANDQYGAGHKMEEVNGKPFDLALVILDEYISPIVEQSS